MLKKRNKPLYTLEEILEKNRISVRDSKSSGAILVIAKKGNRVKVDKDFNLFDKNYLAK